jgi:hypothetical protein
MLAEGVVQGLRLCSQFSYIFFLVTANIVFSVLRLGNISITGILKTQYQYYHTISLLSLFSILPVFYEISTGITGTVVWQPIPGSPCIFLGVASTANVEKWWLRKRVENVEKREQNKIKIETIDSSRSPSGIRVVEFSLEWRQRSST